jgi:PHD/YefM family antitoxin component YafN of YafNO toxin-antitoxin module
MFNQLTIAQAQEQLPDLSQTLQSEPVVIVKDGSPVLITFSIENFLSLCETAEILTDSDLMASLHRGIEQDKEGKYSDIADVKARLGL